MDPYAKRVFAVGCFCVIFFSPTVTMIGFVYTSTYILFFSASMLRKNIRMWGKEMYVNYLRFGQYFWILLVLRYSILLTER